MGGDLREHVLTNIMSSFCGKNNMHFDFVVFAPEKKCPEHHPVKVERTPNYVWGSNHPQLDDPES